MRLRVRFAKLGKVRFTSHRDVARIWERAIRRVELPIAYSQGFTPRPKVSFGLALSTGYESDSEFIDLELEDTAINPAMPGADQLAGLPATLSEALPAGMDVTAIAVIQTGTESLQQAVQSCSWDIALRDVDPDVVGAAVARILAADTIPVTRERKGKPVQDDLRPGVLQLALVRSDAEGVHLFAELGCQPRALRPSELLEAMDLRDHEGLVRRTHQWMYDGHERREPLAAYGATRVPPAGDALRRDDDHVRSTGRPDTPTIEPAEPRGAAGTGPLAEPGPDDLTAVSAGSAVTAHGG